MNPDIKNKWLSALRSGKYEQGRQYLRTPENKFCCLGVLCDVVDPSLWNRPTHDQNSWDYDNGAFAMLPTTLRTNLGVTPIAEQGLASMNDRGESFPDIATWIENYL